MNFGDADAWKGDDRFAIRYYKLGGDDGLTPVPTTLEEWAQSFSKDDPGTEGENGFRRRVAYTEISDEVNVSTIFLGMDHGWGEGPPLLFESMVFWKNPKYPGTYNLIGREMRELPYHGEEMERCSTYAEALDQHHRMVEHAKKKLAARAARRARRGRTTEEARSDDGAGEARKRPRRRRKRD